MQNNCLLLGLFFLTDLQSLNQPENSTPPWGRVACDFCLCFFLQNPTVSLLRPEQLPVYRTVVMEKDGKMLALPL